MGSYSLTRWLGPDESFNAFYARASAKMAEVLGARMLESLKTTDPQYVYPERGKLVLLDINHLARREQARIATISARNPIYIDGLERPVKAFKHPEQKALRRAALWELSWWYWCDPGDPDRPERKLQYNRVMRQLQEMDDAGI